MAIKFRTGITPACAGGTRRPTATSRRQRDHPRMRGEHYNAGAQLMQGLGSPPHARGALQGSVQPGLRRGITPACAGSTGRTAPRRRDAGITPACAGSTGWSRSRCRRVRDHPRMRGEHHATSMVADKTGGSPPHARGARLAGGDAEVHAGITPARAGSTRADRGRARVLRDHPRMRGEHPVSHSTTNSCPGSPPHARGAPDRRRLPDRQRGITPACAGSTPL